MISGKLPNNTVWWLSTNGQKIWIESKDLESEKFKEKGYRTTKDRIFNTVKEVGELTTSRLESRKRKDAWIVKVDAILHIYPELIEDIKRKEIEEKKKKRTNDSSKNKREIRKEFKIDSSSNEHKNEIVTERNMDNSVESIKNPNNEPVRDYFDINRPYVAWIKDEISKSEKEELIISFKYLKSKMGEEFEKMDDFRIFFGLNKVLPNIGMKVESKIIKRESVALIRKC